LVVLTGTTLAACTNGPAYAPPTANLPAGYSSSPVTPAPDLSRNAWWTGFNDPVLNDLINRGLAQNLSLKQAQERVAAARALAEGSGLILSGGLNATADRGSEDDAAVVNSSDAGVGGSVLLDFFGRARKSRESSIFSAEATEAEAQATKLAFLSQLTSAYIDLRYYESLLALRRLDAASRRETRDQTANIAALGEATQIELARSEALVSDSQSQIPQIEAGARRQANRIATLLGVPAGTLRLKATATQPLPRRGTSAGVPADLVRNRPDIRAAERRYAAAVARVGVAEADLYPSISLNGTISAGRVDGTSSNSWSFGPALTLPIFGRKALYANKAAAEADARQALLLWQETVLVGVEEVESALYAMQKYSAASVSARETVAQYTKSRDLSRKLAAEQSVTTLDLINIELEISDARETLAQTQRQVALEYVQLNVALGAGYNFGTPTAVTASAAP